MVNPGSHQDFMFLYMAYELPGCYYVWRDVALAQLHTAIKVMAAFDPGLPIDTNGRSCCDMRFSMLNTQPRLVRDYLPWVPPDLHLFLLPVVF